MNELKKDIIERIKEHLYDYKDVKVYGADLAYTIFEGENIDGTFTYNTYTAEQWIKIYFEDIGEIYEELKFQFDADFLTQYNPFDNPEKFMVLIILEGAGYILGQCKTVEENWDNEFELTEDKIKNIIDEMKNDSYEFYN